jgi:Na+/proline symporter
MSSFSAWTFVACGGRIYKNGPLIAIGFLASGLTGMIMGVGIAAWYRRMRVVTPVDAIRMRFGKATEQAYAWQAIIVQFIFSGVALYILSIVLAPLLGISLNMCIIVVGATVVFMSVAGGAWAVSASDFIQMLVLVIITILTVTLVLRMPEVGGISGFIEQLPDYQTDLTVRTRGPILTVMLLANLQGIFIGLFSLLGGASRFLTARSDVDAKKASIMMGVGFLIGPFIWFIPPMAASFVIPDLHEQFSYLNNPEEAAYIAIASRVLPQGMLGMLACGMFAATMSAMDTGLNRNSGIVVMNVYKPLIRPQASEKELLLVGKLTTLLFGIFMIAGALIYPKLVTFNLFEWTQHLNALIFVPMSIPVAFGLLYKRDKAWVAWTCILFCTFTAFMIKNHIDFRNLALGLGWGELTRLELVDLTTSMTGFAMIILGAVWFLGHEKLNGFLLSIFVFWAAMVYAPFGAVVNVTMATGITFVVAVLWFKMMSYYRANKSIEEKYQANIEEFFKAVQTPVEADPIAHKATDAMQSKKLGVISLVYGVFVSLGILIPNSMTGRMCFGICGFSLLIIGGILCYHYKKLMNESDAVQKIDAKLSVG